MKSGPIVSLVLGVIFAAAGTAVVVFWGKPTLDKAKASTDWPKAPGVVIESELERSESRRAGKRTKTTYSASVVYKFEVNNESYEGDDIWAGQYSSSDRSAMQKLVREYPVGKEVTVYYSPDDPYESVLQPGAFFSSYLGYGVGLVFVVLGSLMVATPLLKGIFLTAAIATAKSSDFAGGGSQGGGDFGGDSHRTNDDGDDGFDGIPES